MEQLQVFFVFNYYVFIYKEPFACQKWFDCIPGALITNKSFGANSIKVILFYEFFQIITYVFRSFIVQEDFS